MLESEWLTSTDPRPMLACIERDPGDHPDRSVYGCAPYRISKRKLRLFACACCREVWDLLPDSRSWQAVEVAERYADGQATEEELRQTQTATPRALDEGMVGNVHAVHDAYASTLLPATLAASRVATLPSPVTYDLQAALLRDLIGNPFHRVTLPWRCRECGPLCGSPAAGYYCTKCGADEARCPWLTDAVLGLAKAIYEERAFEGMPILADALQESGCDNEEMLHHCRGEERCLLYYQPSGGSADCLFCGAWRSINHGWIPLRGLHVRGCWAVDLLLGKE